jgi:hypothetical protein
LIVALRLRDSARDSLILGIAFLEEQADEESYEIHDPDIKSAHHQQKDKMIKERMLKMWLLLLDILCGRHRVHFGQSSRVNLQHHERHKYGDDDKSDNSGYGILFNGIFHNVPNVLIPSNGPTLSHAGTKRKTAAVSVVGHFHFRL